MVKVITRNGILEMPLGLYEAMDKPRWILVRQADACLWIAKTTLVKFIILRQFRNSSILLHLRDGSTEYAGASDAHAGVYHIANYHPNYYLMPVQQDENEKLSRERFWAEIQDYHEHRNPMQQDAYAHKVSHWLAGTVLRSLPAQSFLELGCGAGRNLSYVQQAIPNAEIFGLDINPDAVAIARAANPQHAANIRVGSIYETSQYASGSVDVVFTSGVLMHIPHDLIQSVIIEADRIARVAVIHLELHGPSHEFDYHRYPRDYAHLYAEVLPGRRISYEVFPRGDFRSSGTSSFNLALLVSYLAQADQK